MIRSDNTRTHRVFKLATSNVRTLCKKKQLHQGKILQLEKGCVNHNIELVALQEHRYQAEGGLEEIPTAQGILILAAAGSDSYGGVGLYLRGRFQRLVLDKERISDRILLVYLDTNPRLAIIVVYAPTECANDEDKNDFYGDLNATLEHVEPHCVSVIAGDLNARPGQPQSVS